MFSFFSNKNKNECPVNEDTRILIEAGMLGLIDLFGEEAIKNRKVLVPDRSDFPLKYDGQQQAAFDTMKIVATQMEIDPNEIQLDIYNERLKEIDDGAIFGSRIILQDMAGEKYSGGHYWGRQDDNKYHIGLEEGKLREPTSIIATLAHEFSHIKLLGEKRIEENDEYLLIGA